MGGFNFRKDGALGSSVAHDSHNLIVAGTNARDMLACVHDLEKTGGGFVVAAGGEIRARVPLPIAGLLSTASGDTVCQQLQEAHAVAHSLGCELAAPFGQLSFLALPVIPDLRITDQGLFDVNAQKLLQVFVIDQGKSHAFATSRNSLNSCVLSASHLACCFRFGRADEAPHQDPRPLRYPRPAPKQDNVPLRTSFYIQLGLSEKGTDVVLPESVSLELAADGVPAISLLRPGKEFASGVSGKFIPGKNDSSRRRRSASTWTRASRSSLRRPTRRGYRANRRPATLPEKDGTWQFTTESAPTTHWLRFAVPADSLR